MFLIALFALPTVTIVSAKSSSASFSHCDYNSIPTSTKLSSLTSNKFYKLCPPRHATISGNQRSLSSSNPLKSSSSLNPICGDGTAFSFYLTKPAKKYEHSHKKLLIELQGGGACWDDETCDMNDEYLTFPSDLYDSLVGNSCSQIEYILQNSEQEDNREINMLCAEKFGDVDLAEYTTVIIPYCTQDVHIGNSQQYYGDGDDVTYHMGAHNIVSTLNYLFDNMKDVSHIVLTGCSAGGTGVPFVYNLLHKQYTKLFGFHKVNINVLADSPVYLTPSYFMSNIFENWNPWDMVKLTGFRYSKFKTSEEFATKLWHYIVGKGAKRDIWGFISHTQDPVSLYYWQAMSGGAGDDDQYNNNDDGYDSWYSALSSSISSLKKKHGNFKTFWMESEGHCSFGLYAALKDGSGFKAWAASIIRERLVLQKFSSSLFFFVVAIVFGGILTFMIIRERRSQMIHNESIDQMMIQDDDASLQRKRQTGGKYSSILMKMIPFPLTSGYFMTITLYFLGMILSDGFVHILNNPSLGPSAVGLSAFGINNPSLIVYKSQVWRLLSSNIMCSGLFAYLIVVVSILKDVRYLELEISDNRVYFMAMMIIAVGSNLVYAFIGNGASCGTISLILGLNAFSIAMARENIDSRNYPKPIVRTVLFFLLSTLFFPFDSWIIMLSGIIIGAFLLPKIFTAMPADDITGQVQPIRMNQRMSRVVGAVFFIMFGVLLFRLRRPNRLYTYPYFTGCKLAYTTQVSEIVSEYGGNSYMNDDNNNNNNNNNNGRRTLLLDPRKLQDEEGDDDGISYNNLCAQVCIPHLAFSPTLLSIKHYTNYSLKKGTCENQGYKNHMIDESFERFSLTLDVEIYSNSNYNAYGEN